MSGFMDLVKDIPMPWDIAKKTAEAPFTQRTDQPWLQGTARNLGHAAFGDKIGNSVDQKILRDTPGGYRGVEVLPSTSVNTGTPQANMTAVPVFGQQQQQQNNKETDPMALFAALLQASQQQGGN